jgi:hypothetical protein
MLSIVIPCGTESLTWEPQMYALGCHSWGDTSNSWTCHRCYWAVWLETSRSCSSKMLEIIGTG